MPDCVAPGCDLGRKSCSAKRSRFSFPGDPVLLAQWIRNLRRPGFIPSYHSRVCEAHFEERFIIRVDRIRQRDGSVVVRQRKKLDLTPDAVPTLFPSTFAVTTPAGKQVAVPGYLSKKPTTPRACPEARRKTAENLQAAKEAAERELRMLKDYDQLMLYLGEPGTLEFMKSKGWLAMQSEQVVNLCRLVRSAEGVNFMQMDVEIDVALVPVIRSYEIRGSTVISTGRRTGKVLKSRDDVEVFLCCDSKPEHAPSENELVREITEQMEKLGVFYSDNAEKKAKATFLLEQVQTLPRAEKGVRYSPELYAWAAALFTKSPAGYRFLRNTCALTLPGESTLRKILKPYKSEPGLSDPQLKLIERLARKHQEPRKRVISLHLDEINVRPAYSYKAGKISGQAHNGDGPATEILGFMISGLLSGMREMISLLPVRNTTADEIYLELMSVMQALEERGFAVVVLITDNHKKNQRLYSMLCQQSGSPDQSSSIPHPFDALRLLFLLLDPVHIVKCLRNNWFNRGDLVFPNILSFFSKSSPPEERTCTARWIHLSYAYSLEQSKSLRVTQLTETAIAPNNLEKQNVNLALKVFCEKTARGVELLSKQFAGNAEFRDVSGTVNLIDAVVRLWRMWNIRRTNQHLRHMLPEMKPFEALDDERFKFMEDFLAWVRAWQAECIGNKKAQGLTIDTFKSLCRTLEGLANLIKYLLSDCAAQFVLTSKISNDIIEGRFRSYRNLSGSSYLVSVTEVMESQGRLQLIGYLRAHRVLFGTARLEGPFNPETASSADEATIVQWFWANVDPAEHFPEGLTDCENSVFLFVSGYCAFKACQKISCDTCISLLKCTSEMEYQLDPTGELVAITGLDRGKLAYPTGFTRAVARYCYFVFSILTSATNEKLFLSVSKDHRDAVRGLSIYYLAKQCPSIVDDVCLVCGVSTEKRARALIKICTNTLLNGYQKKKNDDVRREKRKHPETPISQGAKKLKKFH